jgi:tRNA threonylcarbamoyladenosine biosynthesis protein TsaE
MQKLKNLTLSQVQGLASTLGRNFKGQNVTIGLSGQLGAGKTTFAKSFARTLGIKKVKSPTFTLINEYPLKNSRLYHIDLYRLQRLDQLQEIGISDLLLQPSRIVLIEWVDKFPKLKKLCDINIKLTLTENNTRNVQIVGI